MSHRPILKKKANRLRKALRTTPGGYIDLVVYLKDRRFARTTGEAEKLILDGRVRSESHKLGIGKGMKVKESSKLAVLLGRPLEESDFEETDVVERRVPAKVRASIQVLPA